jgi:hypothetical protein
MKKQLFDLCHVSTPFVVKQYVNYLWLPKEQDLTVCSETICKLSLASKRTRPECFVLLLVHVLFVQLLFDKHIVRFSFNIFLLPKS